MSLSPSSGLKKELFLYLLIIGLSLGHKRFTFNLFYRSIFNSIRHCTFHSLLHNGASLEYDKTIKGTLIEQSNDFNKPSAHIIWFLFRYRLYESKRLYIVLAHASWMKLFQRRNGVEFMWRQNKYSVNFFYFPDLWYFP